MKIVLISLDSVRSNFFGPESRTEDTENIDKLCRKGKYFPNTIVQAPFTAPSHGAMLTGLFPYNNGIRNFEGELRSDIDTVFDYMKEEDFSRSTFLGSGMLKNRGFENWNLKGFEYISEVKKELEDKEDKFVFVHYWNTHTPYKSKLPNSSVKNFLSNICLTFSEILGLKRGYMGPNESSVRNFWRMGYKYFWSHRMHKIRDLMAQHKNDTRERMIEGYKKSIQEADEYIGEIIESLEEDNEDFVLIVTADHGESFNEHDERDEFEEFEHGFFLYENAIKVPTVIYGSNIEPETCKETVMSIDIVPTVMDLIGKEVDVDGRSLLRNYNRIAYSGVNRPPECDKKSVQNDKKKLIRSQEGETFFDLPEETEGAKSEELSKELKNHLENEKENNKASKEEEIKEQLENLGYS